MKLANAIEGGITGATTLSLLQEALHKIDTKAPRAKLLNSPGIIKRLKKQSKKGMLSNKLYINLASELLSNAAYFGLTALGKKKNAVLRGGLLGAAAGLGSAFLNDADKDDPAADTLKSKILTLTLYTAGGMLAGAAIKKISKKRKKSK